MTRITHIAVTLTLLWGMPLCAHGQEDGAAKHSSRSKANDSELTEAKKRFIEGTKAFNLGEFPRAAKEYRAAYNLKPDPVFLYNLAQAYRLSNDLKQAVFFYRSFLRTMPKATNRAEVEGRIEALEAQLAKQEQIVSAPPNLPVAPGMMGTEGRQAEAAPKAEPEPAPTASVRVQPSASPTVDEPAAHEAPLVVVETASPTLLSPAASETATAHIDLVEQPKDTGHKATPVYKKWWLWTVVGVAAVGIGLGVGLGIALSAPGTPASHFGTVSVF